MSLTEFLVLQEELTLAAAAEPPPVLTSQPAGDQSPRDIGPLRLGPGDTLVITHFGTTVEGATTVPDRVRIDREGNIELPVVGKVKVAGMDLVEADKAIQAALVPNVYRDTVVHVSLLEPESTRVVVFGAVMTPGLVQLRSSERNLLFATNAGGGMTDNASGYVTLKRLRSDETARVNIRDPEQLKAVLAMSPLQDGDLVSVEAAKPNTVFVGGLVTQPHPQIYPQGTEINILQAIAAAGGLRTDVTPREGTLIRRMPDGRDVQVKLDMDRITRGQDPNLTLAAGDVLWIPDTLETRVQDWCNRNLFFRAGASATYSLDYSMPGVDYLNKAAANSFNGFNNNQTQQNFDPFGFLQQNQSLNAIQNQLP